MIKMPDDNVAQRSNGEDALQGALAQAVTELPQPRSLDEDVVQKLVDIAGHVMALQQREGWGDRALAIEHEMMRVIQEAEFNVPTSGESTPIMVLHGTPVERARIMIRKIIALHTSGQLVLE